MCTLRSFFGDWVLLLQTTQEAHGVDNKNVQLECPISQQDVESQQPRQLCLADRCQRRQ